MYRIFECFLRVTLVAPVKLNASVLLCYVKVWSRTRNIEDRMSLSNIPVMFMLIIPSNSYLPITVAAPSKAWVCGRLLTGIVGSNPAGDMDVCLLGVLCVVR
jgi:hypothetical protein